MTVKTRITLFIVGAGLISSFLFSVAVFCELIEQPFELLDNILKEEARRVTEEIAKKFSETNDKLPEYVARDMEGYWVEIRDHDTHRTLFRSAMAQSVSLPPVGPGERTVVSASIPNGQVKTDRDGDGKTAFRIRSFSMAFGGRSYVTQIARPMEKLEEEIWELVLGILSGLVFSTLILIAISRFMAGKVLRPIGEMNDLAKVISEKNLDRRIPAGEGPDEFSRLARTINRMLDRLQYSFERQRNFLFDTSHELKTPLTTIRLAVEEICANDAANSPPFARDNLLRLNAQVLRMERLVKDLLSLSSMETTAVVDSNPVDMTWILSCLAEEYGFLAEARGIEMDIRLPPKLIVQGDRDKLRRAFSNIFDNAVKYNEEGGRIELTGCKDADGVSVIVGNTGPGVAESEIPKVFDQFYRVEKSRSVEHGGSGLGLAMVKRIVELHGGETRFESTPGEWTQVTVTLPDAGK